MLAPSGPKGQEEAKDIKAVVKEVCSPERPGSLPLKVSGTSDRFKRYTSNILLWLRSLEKLTLTGQLVKWQDL